MALHVLKFEGDMFIGQPGFPVVLFFPGQNSSKHFFLMTRSSNEVKSPESSRAEQTLKFCGKLKLLEAHRVPSLQLLDPIPPHERWPAADMQKPLMSKSQPSSLTKTNKSANFKQEKHPEELTVLACIPQIFERQKHISFQSKTLCK